MAFIIAVAQQKGGAGKSTVTANLAAALAADFRVALLDTDPQATLSRWAELRAGQPAARPLTFEAVSGWRVPASIDKLARDHDIVLLDTAPHAETDSKVAIRAASLVLIPMQPAGPDLWASEATLKLAGSEKRQALVLLNRVPAQGRLKDQIGAELDSRKLATLGPGWGNRTGFATAFMQGLGVTEASPRSTAAEEVLASVAALKALMPG
ncbi:ParA family partition ATPase [Rhodovarius lipocyclicus]|jgi:chromosome partitioning protein|uniref:ParA family partition ATPase n=1 Tax=Rhodovarius lipocyclicus TaxID=268410 RepID=UPI001358AC1C|nr:ParA family partition ATPase [Rhodovarius lipocyclicus]